MSARFGLRLRTWLALLVVGVTAPLLLFAGAMLWWVLDRQADQGKAELQDRVRAVAAALDTEIRAWKTAVDAMAASSDLLRERWGDFDAEARRVAAEHDGWVLVDDPTTQMRINTLRPFGERLPKTNPEIHACYEDRATRVLDPYVGTVARRLILVVAKPILRDGTPVYCLHMNFGPERLAGLLEVQQLPPTWAASLMDREHRIVARLPHRENRVGQPVQPALQAAFAASPRGLIEETTLTDNRVGRVAFQRLAEVPWTFAIIVPLAEVQAAWRLPFIAFGVLGLLLTLSAVGVAVVVGRQIAWPFQALAARAPSVVRGQALEDVSSPPIQEVQRLREALAEAGAKARAYEQELERTVAERTAALRDRDEQHRIALDAANLGTWRYDGATGIIHFDERARRHHGVAADAMPLLTVLRRIHAEDRGRLKQEIRRALDGARSTGHSRIEYRVVRSEGDPCWLEAHVHIAFAAGLDRRATRATGTSRDITERKRREAALAQSNTFLRAILDQAAEEIVVRDATGRLLLANAAVRRDARAAPEGTGVERLPAIWGDMLDRQGRPIPPDAWPIRRALNGERGRTVEFRRVTPDGRERVLLNTATPIVGPTGQLIGAVSVSAEITDLTRREEELRSALADKETLLREVHHRVKNNLQTLCDLLYLQMEGMRDKERQADLQDAYSRVYAIARLHEQLYQSIENGRVRLPAYLTRLIQGFGDLYLATPITLDAPESELALDVDRAIHVGLIVNELVTNAMKHAFAGRQDGRVDVCLRRRGDQLELQVRDNGSGLPPHTDLTQATTLGLRIVRILVRSLRATVDVKNDHGTTFTLTLPLHADALRERRHE
jgi:PAS domain S-box-containing protein